MKQYLDVLADVLEYGVYKEGRNGGTRSLVNKTIVVPLYDSMKESQFPLLTSKYVHFHSVKWELLWFLSGSKYIGLLQHNKVTIWDEWADADGYVGNMYGSQWRKFLGYEEMEVDQIRNSIDLLKKEPNSRRNLVTAWNPPIQNIRNPAASWINQRACALPPCHYAFQLITENNSHTNNGLSIIVNMRSTDLFLGAPFNIASYALLLEMYCKECGFTANTLYLNMGDCHLYENHIEAAIKQLRNTVYHLPSLDLTDFDFEKCLVAPESQSENIKVLNYKHSGRIPAPISK